MTIVKENFEENVFNDPMYSVFLQLFVPQHNGWSTEESTTYRWTSCYWNRRDLPAHEHPPDEPSPCDHDPVFPGPQNVLCEDDIIGVRASIVYENCLRQLATFLILPVDKCTGLLRTGAPCNSVAPFEINITTKGTPATIAWICL
ncbi:hypothetical protein UPYG_G00201740 [Umbra pygmaea]|uniref:Uncharacterized protein n=1 Tax=Umbra pygmaea TaxID=75934 RepID=A0ABD0X2H1_UMBPY